MIPTIACIFRHTTTLDCDRAALLAGLQTYVDEHLGPVWLKGARVVLKAGADEGDWPLYFLDDADQAGALGYHTDPDGAGPKPPMGFVFVRTAIVDGNPVSFVASHELAEMLVDPGCNLGALTPRLWGLSGSGPSEAEGALCHHRSDRDPLHDVSRHSASPTVVEPCGPTPSFRAGRRSPNRSKARALSDSERPLSGGRDIAGTVPLATWSWRADQAADG